MRALDRSMLGLSIMSPLSRRLPRRRAARRTIGPFVQGGTATGRMQLVNDGGPCGFTFKFGGSFEPSD